MGSALVCAIGLVVRAACLVWPSGVWVPVRSMAVPGSSRWVSAWWHWEDTMYFGWVGVPFLRPGGEREHRAVNRPLQSAFRPFRRWRGSDTIMRCRCRACSMI